ncbi:AbrB/MazE/SpoVT family DNA-binding domain-containing protein [Periweissella cryptocerci]|uniref:AbrB/MazE/SpoVT family DNA-binding domain-containing protein n=1 Tax=Periweissella cryptocerci TaxID=2506420 RepID=A0A4P6YV21_9LACO|nr:AbrB/MazE/SpoVT family DNA-binding domain-containing protein [Periweissella cryptocerci]QBO36648.1 AbrB/MazE/SpoVT family DNA-binding domain-containing protein [Periweissella cryptocerci]
MDDKHITLPPEIINQLDIDPHKPVQLTVNDNKLQLNQNPDPREKQSMSLRYFITPTILATILFFIRFTLAGQSLVPLTGNNSLENMTFLLGTLTGFIVFSIIFISQKRRRRNTTVEKIYWRNFPTIAIAFGSMLFLVLIGTFELLGTLFVGANFDVYTATILFFIFVAIINYTMINLALSITPSLIINLLMTVIIGGMTLAMISNSSLKWWHRNFSFLGTTDANKSWEFNLTLVLSALLMIALIDYLFVAIHQAHYKSLRLTTLRVLLTLTATSFGAVGLIPNNGDGIMHILHDQSARILVLFIIALIIGLRWLIPNISREFLQVSYAIAIGLIIALILFLFVGYFSLTSFELISASMSIGWILLLLQTLLKFTVNTEKTYTITIEASK